MRVRTTHARLQTDLQVEELMAFAKRQRLAWMTGEASSAQMEELAQLSGEFGYSLWAPRLKGEAQSSAWIAVRKDLMTGSVEQSVIPIEDEDTDELLNEVVAVFFNSDRFGSEVAVVTVESRDELDPRQNEAVANVALRSESVGAVAFFGGEYPERPDNGSFEWNSVNYKRHDDDGTIVVIAAKNDERVPNEEPLVLTADHGDLSVVSFSVN